MSLTICLLTRNAADRIGTALRSVAGLGAEVLVADTGSADGTVAAARATGARVCVIPWHDDFAAAQNQALDQASGDWVFWLNPDEELLPHSPEHLAALLARPDALAYVVRVQEVMKADRPDEATEAWQPRLVRRHADLRYVGRLHPHFALPLEVLARREHKHVGLTDLLVRRHGYLSVLTEDKLRWATRLLELELKDRPGQLHYLIEYGHNLLRLNDPRGHAVLAEASELVLTALDATAAPTPTVASLLEYLLTVSPQQSRSRLSPAQARSLALRWFPHSPPLLWQLAHNSFQARDFRDAAALLERNLHLGRTGTYDRSAAFDPTIMGEPALLNLGRCYARLGDLDRAEACFGQLLASPTHQAQARHEYDLLRQLRNRPRQG
ncbi:MAG TPA: glycosyltransferase [Gemmataceae bacterium]|nr:glycosyltransferase [Gemmataceae bacterium]